MEHLPTRARLAARDEPTDGELLERFVKAREETAFTELVRRHGAMVHGVCRRVLDHAEDVEDAFQATFMVLVRKASSIRKRDSAASWLYGVALRVARRARAALTRRRDHERRAAQQREIVTDVRADWGDVRPMLDDAVDRLPEKYRALVVLCYLEGKTYDEAAGLLGMAKGTISTRLTQARTLMRRHLRRRGLVLSVAVLGTFLEENAAPAAVPPRLPGRALEAARAAAGMGGAVSPQVVSLAKGTLRQLGTIKPFAVAVLALLLAAGAIGLFAWGSRSKGTGSIDAKQNWEARYKLGDHSMLAWGLTFSPDGQTLVTQAGDGNVRLWDVATGHPNGLLRGNGNSMTRFLGFAFDGRTAATGGQEVTLWELGTNRELARFSGSAKGVFTPDRKSLASIDPQGEVHWIDVAGRKEQFAPGWLPGQAISLAFSQDGGLFALGTRDGSISLREAPTLQERRRLPGIGVPVLDLVFSPDGAALAGIIGPEQPNNLASGQGEVRVWPVAGGEARRLNAANIGSIGYSPDGKYLATRSANGAIDLWDPATGTHLRRLTGLLVNAGMTRIVFSPDGKSIVTPGPGRDVQLRDPATGQVRATLKGHTQQLFDAAFSPDGKLLVTGSIALGQDGESNQAEVIVWERLP